MTLCEKCWSDAHLKSMDACKTQTAYYYELIKGKEHKKHSKEQQI